MDHVVQLFKLFTLPEIDQFGDSLLEGGGRSLAKIHPLALELPSLNISASSGLRVYGRGSGDRLPVIAERVLDILEGDLLL